MTTALLRESQAIVATPAAGEKPAAKTASDLRQDKPRLGRSRWFYSFAAAAMLVITFIGFSHFYLSGRAYPGRPLTPPIRGIIITHGISMSAWMLLFVIQPALIGLRGYKAHMFLGRIGSLLALSIVFTGLWIAFASARVAPPDMRWFGMNAAQFISVPLITIALFGGFVGVAIWKRKQPNMHKALMFLGTLAAVSASLGRIDTLINLYSGTIFERLFGAFPMTLALGVILLAIKTIWERSFDRTIAAGLSILAAAYFVTTQVAMTTPFENAMKYLIGLL